MDYERPAGVPIPGTEPTPRGLFLDVWGTLVELPDGSSPRSPKDVKFLPGVLDALHAAHRRGWKVYLVGNDFEVALGRRDERDQARIEETLLGGLTDAGIVLARNYVCTKHPSGNGRFKGDSVYMLPGTGAFYHAAHTDGIAMNESWVIGDSTLELVAGWRAGLHTCGVSTGLGLRDREYHVEIDTRFPSLFDFLSPLLDRVLHRAG